jgi:hypothetical protein
LILHDGISLDTACAAVIRKNLVQLKRRAVSASIR